MSNNINNIKEKKFQHITYTDRVLFEKLLKNKKTIKEIAGILEKSMKTIKREIKRGLYQHLNSDLTYANMYSADKAQADYDEKQTTKGPNLKIGKDHNLNTYFVDGIIKYRKSPEVLVAEMKDYEEKNGIKFIQRVSPSTVRNYIKNEIFVDISEKDMIYPRKNKIKKEKRRKIPKVPEKSIDKRPEETNNREKDGDWEGDLVVGKQGTKTVLFTLTNRKHREEIIRKLKDKRGETILEAINKLELEYGERFREEFKSITFDNGSEFLDWENLEKSIIDGGKRTTIYYAHPFSSYERGTNENANRMIRRFIPKGVDIDDYSDEYIKWVQDWINNFSRPMFGFKSALQMKLRA